MAVVIVSYETRELTIRAIQSVVASTGVDAEIWVVDNASRDGSAEATRSEFPSVRLIQMERNVGFGRANNAALDRIDAPYVLLLNSDAALPEPTTLARLVESLDARPASGIVGPLLRTSHGRTWYSAHPFPSMRVDLVRAIGLYPMLPRRTLARWLAKEYHDQTIAAPVDWLTGACMLVRGNVMRLTRGFDPALFLYAEDLDLCWRVREAGWEVTLDPTIGVLHEGGASSEDPSVGMMRVAVAGEAYVVRKHRGSVYFLAFAAVKASSYALRWMLQGAVGLLTGSEARRKQSTEARFALSVWIFVLRRGGATDPGSDRFLRRAGSMS